jgi:hypothetical protein
MQRLGQVFELTEEGDAQWYLSIEIIRDRQKRTIHLSHKLYISKIATKFGIANNSSIPSTPLPTFELIKHTGQASPEQIKLYQEIVGLILYTAIIIRVDVAHAVSVLSRFLTNPSEQHFHTARQTLRYLFATSEITLQYGQSSEIQILLIASDTSYSDNRNTRRSSQGYVIIFNRGPII